MAVYQKKFTFNNRSNKDFGLIVARFEPDNGEVDSYLTTESVYTDSYNGTKRYDYGAKYTSTTILYITMLKNNYADFSRRDLREVLDWLTSLKKVSWLDLYNDDTGEFAYSFLGRVINVRLQKLDSRIVGVNVEFESVSPWAYSNINHNEMTLDGKPTLYHICNSSDESSVYIYPNITFVNKFANGSLSIVNNTTGEETLIKNLGVNEIVKLDSNKIIYSDKPNKVFGDDFNSNWLRFVQGYNHLNITGNGHLIIEHRDIIKVADAFDDADFMDTTPADKNALLLAHIHLMANKWVKDVKLTNGLVTYYQPVKIVGVTPNSLINMQPTEAQLLSLQAEGVELQIANDNGNAIVYAYGDYPSNNYEMQVTVEETDLDIAHRYGVVHLYANAWAGQGNRYTQPVYLTNLTKRSIIDLDLTEVQEAALESDGITLLVANENKNAVAYALGFKPDTDYDVAVIITETVTQPSKVRTVNENTLPYAEPYYF